MQSGAKLWAGMQDAVWGGDKEIQAASMCFERNIFIFQQGQPCWRVVNFMPAETYPGIFLSYHDGDHYNSIRLADDFNAGSPEPINLADCQVDGQVAADTQVALTVHARFAPAVCHAGDTHGRAILPRKGVIAAPFTSSKLLATC